MAPRPAAGPPPRRNPARGRPAAGLVLFYPGPSGPSFVLILRSDALLAHPGQIGLPGGGLELGETADQAALREANEEIGVTLEAIRLLGNLSPVYIPPTDVRLAPFVGCAGERPSFRPQASEVARILEVPLVDLLDPRSRREETRPMPDGALTTIPYYALDGEKVWGATAMVLAELGAVFARWR